MSPHFLQPPSAVKSSSSLASSVSSSSSSSGPASRNASSTNLSINTTAPDHVSSAKPRQSFRDRLAAGLHEHLPGLSLSGRVKAKILNQTPYPAQIVAWPRKTFYESTNTEGDDCDIQMATHRGTTWENEVLEADTVILPDDKGEGGRGVEIGSMRKAHSWQHHTHRGWIYLDLVKQDGTAVHLQIYLHLSRNGMKHRSSLGRFDLDSSAAQPQPSGVLGRVVYKKTDDEITYVITPDVADAQNTVDDSTKLPSRLLLGKGVEATTYVHYPGCRLSLFVGKEARYHEHSVRVDDEGSSRAGAGVGELKHTKHEVEGATSKFVGLCSQYLGREVFKAHVKIHPVTGIMDSGKGSLANTLKTKAIFSEPDDKGKCHVLTYGFSDQGSGKADQIYAYLTRAHERWLGDLIDDDERWLDVPFGKLALSGAHDAGMWESLNPGLLFVIENGTLAKGLAQSSMLDLGTPVVRALVRALEKISFRPERALQNLANTQKDDTATLLRLGTRFFDFRPGYNFYNAINADLKEIRHQHALVPGETYLSFLSSILVFLARNPKEIVVVELKKDGFVLSEDKHDKDGKLVANSMIPTEEALADVLRKAREGTGVQDVQVADAAELDSPIGQLIEGNTRLFIIDRVHHPQAWYRSDSYDPVAHATDNPATIMAQLELTHATSSKADEMESTPKRGCIYQLQATPTSRMVDAAKSALTFSDASSLLVWMKSRQDRETYPWISKTRFHEPGLVVFLNDFCDGALVDHTIQVCRERAGLA